MFIKVSVSTGSSPIQSQLFDLFIMSFCRLPLDTFMLPRATIYFNFLISVPVIFFGIYMIGADVLLIIEVCGISMWFHTGKLIQNICKRPHLAQFSFLSKRHGATSVGQFKEMGYLPQAMVNYKALLGWGDGTKNEFYTFRNLVDE
ncbi:hypothetical protein Droror1_Dr00010830 [Drosera rotundifolia]